MSPSPSFGLQLVWYREQVFRHTTAADWIFPLLGPVGPIWWSSRSISLSNTPTCSLSGADNHVQHVQSHLNHFSSSFWCSCISLFKSVAAAILFLLFDLNLISFSIICRTQHHFSLSFISTMQRASRGGGRVWINTNRYSAEEFAPCNPFSQTDQRCDRGQKPSNAFEEPRKPLLAVVQKQGNLNGQHGVTLCPVHCSHLRRDLFSAATTQDQAVSSQWVDVRSEAAEHISQLGAQTLSQLRGGSDDQTHVCRLLFKHAHSQQKSEARVSYINY